MPNNPRFLELLDEMRELYMKKNAAYAGLDTTDPYKNFRFSEQFGVSPFVGCLIRMGDKIMRVGNLVKRPDAEQVGESIVDTLMDLAVYCINAICLYEEERRRK